MKQRLRNYISIKDTTYSSLTEKEKKHKIILITENSDLGFEYKGQTALSNTTWKRICHVVFLHSMMRWAFFFFYDQW